MKAFINRNQLIVFFVLTFLFSWFPWYAGIAPEVMTMGPSLAAFLLVFVVNGKQGFADLLKPFGRWRVVSRVPQLAGSVPMNCSMARSSRSQTVSTLSQIRRQRWSRAARW